MANIRVSVGRQTPIRGFKAGKQNATKVRVGQQNAIKINSSLIPGPAGKNGDFGDISKYASPGQILFINDQNLPDGTNDLTFDGTNVYVAGNIGIGSSAPREKLEIGGNMMLDGQFIINDSAGISTIISSENEDRYLQNVILDFGGY